MISSTGLANALHFAALQLFHGTLRARLVLVLLVGLLKAPRAVVMAAHFSYEKADRAIIYWNISLTDYRQKKRTYYDSTDYLH
jgi:hypothetical protein